MTDNLNRDQSCHQVTVRELIDYLKANFSLEDKLCYWHEGGAWIDCEPLYRSELGKVMLRTVAQDKRERFGDEANTGENNEDYRNVSDSDIIIY